MAIPRIDADFDTYAASFASTVNAALGDYSLVAADMTPVTAALATWNAKYPAHIAAQAFARAASAEKLASRTTLERAIRVVTNKIQGAGPAVTDASRAKAGVPIRDKTRTRPQIPTTAPHGTIDTSQRLQHTVGFRDSTTLTTKAKPRGVRGCELFVKIGGLPPADISECRYVATDTNSPYIYAFDGQHAGQMAHWMLRWVNARSEPGPWSETVSATVPG